MARRVIDMTNDPRRGQFEYFRAMPDPWAGITVPVDITDFLAAVRKRGKPFFLSVLYAVVRAANAVPELRRRLLPDGRVVEYDRCDASYTVMKPDGTGVYLYCLLENDLSSYEKFIAEGKRRQEETLARGTLTEACRGCTTRRSRSRPPERTTATPALRGGSTARRTGARCCRCRFLSITRCATGGISRSFIRRSRRSSRR